MYLYYKYTIVNGDTVKNSKYNIINIPYYTICL